MHRVQFEFHGPLATGFHARLWLPNTALSEDQAEAVFAASPLLKDKCLCIFFAGTSSHTHVHDEENTVCTASQCSQGNITTPPQGDTGLEAVSHFLYNNMCQKNTHTYVYIHVA